MADQVSERIRIEASPSRCFEVATDFERYPAWARDVKEATVVDQRGKVVLTRVALSGDAFLYG